MLENMHNKLQVYIQFCIFPDQYYELKSTKNKEKENVLIPVFIIGSCQCWWESLLTIIHLVCKYTYMLLCQKMTSTYEDVYESQVLYIQTTSISKQNQLKRCLVLHHVKKIYKHWQIIIGRNTSIQIETHYLPGRHMSYLHQSA